MITLQHSALYLLALNNKRKSNYLKEFMSEIPFVLLPDAIRAYIPERQAGHFEYSPCGRYNSWMRFPSEEEIKKLTFENAREMIDHYIVPDAPKCVIGEVTSIRTFNQKNWGHKHFHSLRIHELQDSVLDYIFRDDMLDVTERFSNRYLIRHSGVVIDGKTVREQLAMFEEMAFIRLVEIIYQNTGKLLNQGWFERNVLYALLDAYPEDMATNTYRYMQMSKELNERINSKNFALTEEEKAALIITDKFDQLVDEMYSEAYIKTYQEL